MKMTKKVLFGAAILAMVFGFASCKQDDDPNGMITGSNNNYAIDYTNESTTEISRGYNTSTLKHAGALVKITFEKTAGNGGMMGFVFDYEQTNGKSTFNVVGVRQDGGYYISKFANIVDLQAKNFGATTTATGDNPKEVEYVAWSNSSPKKLTNYTQTDGAYLWVIQSEDGTNYKVYNLDKATAESAVVADAIKGVLKDKNGNEITLPTALATIPTGYTAQAQKRYGVYANVYASSSVKGTWTLLGTYKEAEAIADAE